MTFLLQKFITKPLNKDVPDVHFAVLSMILNLSNNPLESVYYQTQFKTKFDDSEKLEELIKQDFKNIAEQVIQYEEE